MDERDTGRSEETVAADDSGDGEEGSESGDAAVSEWVDADVVDVDGPDEELETDMSDELDLQSAVEARRDDASAPVLEHDDPAVESVREAVLGDVKAFFELDDEAASEMPADPEPDGEDSLLSDVTELFGRVREQAELGVPDTAFVENRFFDFGYLAGREEVERYWVNRPFAYVSVLYDPDRKRYHYHVSEPVLNEFEQYVRDDLVRILRNSLMYQDLSGEGERERVFAERAGEVIAEHAAAVNPGSVRKVLYYLLRDFVDFGEIDPLMRDANIEDVSCDGTDVPVYIYHRRLRDLRTNVTFDRDRLSSFTVRLAQRAGKHISVSDPLVDASLPDGSRIQLTLGGDVAHRGPNFTIRKFSEVPLTPVDLVDYGTFSAEQMAYFWLAIENNRSLVFAGGTGSGKTTSLNAVSFFIPPDSKVVSIEDTREITLPHDNWVQSTTRGAVTASGRGEVTTYDLLQAALRQRPEYILVGEIRTEQRVALTFFQAIGTGHTAYTTVHADSTEGALSRLQNPPLSVPAQMLQELDIVSVQRQLYLDDRRVRRNVEVTELYGDPEAVDHLDVETVFEREGGSDAHVRVGESAVLADIADQRGWSDEQVATELAERERILRYLLEEDIRDYADVSNVIHTYARDPEFVMARIEADELDPADLPGQEPR